MKLPLTIVTLLLSLITFAPEVKAQDCSCKASDNKCEMRLTCRLGCTALCTTNDACYSTCGNPEIDLIHVRVTLKFKGNSTELASELSRMSGKKIEFLPRKEGPLNLDLKEGPLWNALDFLSRRGAVTVGGIPFEKFQKIRRTMLKGGKVSMNFDKVPLKDAVAKLSSLSGLPFRVRPEDAERLISISLEDLTLKEIVARISAQTGVKIEQAASTR